MQPVQRRITKTALYLVVVCELSIHGISKSRSAHGEITMLRPAQIFDRPSQPPRKTMYVTGNIWAAGLDNQVLRPPVEQNLLGISAPT